MHATLSLISISFKFYACVTLIDTYFIQILCMRRSHWYLFRSNCMNASLSLISISFKFYACITLINTYFVEILCMQHSHWYLFRSNFMHASLSLISISFKFYACITLIDMYCVQILCIRHSHWYLFRLNFIAARPASISWKRSKLGFLQPTASKIADKMAAVRWFTFSLDLCRCPRVLVQLACENLTAEISVS